MSAELGPSRSRVSTTQIVMSCAHEGSAEALIPLLDGKPDLFDQNIGYISRRQELPLYLVRRAFLAAFDTAVAREQTSQYVKQHYPIPQNLKERARVLRVMGVIPLSPEEIKDLLAFDRENPTP